jgi:hypothetical protein
MSEPLGRGGVENAVKESETVGKGFFFIFTCKWIFLHSSSDFLHLTAPIRLDRSVPWFTLFVCVHFPYSVCCIHIPWWQKQQLLWSVYRCLPRCMVPCLRRQLKLAVVSVEETERPAYMCPGVKFWAPKCWILQAVEWHFLKFVFRIQTKHHRFMESLHAQLVSVAFLFSPVNNEVKV